MAIDSDCYEFDPSMRFVDQAPHLAVIASQSLSSIEWLPPNSQRLSKSAHHALIEELAWRSVKPTWSLVIQMSPLELRMLHGIGERRAENIVSFLLRVAEGLAIQAEPPNREAAANYRGLLKWVEAPDWSSRHPQERSSLLTVEKVQEAAQNDDQFSRLVGNGHASSLRLRQAWMSRMEVLERWLRYEANLHVAGDRRVSIELAQECGSIGVLPEEVEEALHFVMRGDVTEDSDRPESLLDLFDEVVASLDERERQIYFAREATLKPMTLAEVGTLHGVTRERIRQISAKANKKVRKKYIEPRYDPIRWRVHSLSLALGKLVPVEHPLMTETLQRLLGDLEGPFASFVLVQAKYRYIAKGAWLSNDKLTVGDVASALRLDASDTLELRTPLSDLLNRLGCAPIFHEAIVEATGLIKEANGKHYLQGQSLEDKAMLALTLAGRPMSPQEIVSSIGKYNERGLRSRLQNDERFSRVAKNSYALKVWGYEEYSTITAAISDAIEESGHPLPISELAKEVSAKFGVSETSVRAFCSAPRFVVDNGLVRLRTQEEPFVVEGAIKDVGGLYRFGRRVVFVIDVSADMMRGSGRSIDVAIAKLIQLAPGSTRVFGEGSMALRFTWPITAVNPSMGSIRDALQFLQVSEGHRVRVELNLDSGEVDYSPIDLRGIENLPVQERLQALTGVRARDKSSAIDQIAVGLEIASTSLMQALRSRGDNDVVEALSSGMPVLDLDAALHELEAAVETL